MPSNEETLRALMQYDAIPPAYRGAAYAAPIQGGGGRGPQPQDIANTTGISPAQAAAMAQAYEAQIWQALARQPPVQPRLPVQGQYGLLASRMAGPSPVTSGPPQQQQQMGSLPTGLAPPQRLLQRFGGPNGY